MFGVPDCELVVAHLFMIYVIRCTWKRDAITTSLKALDIEFSFPIKVMN